jgi:DNA replication protein DnaC
MLTHPTLEKLKTLQLRGMLAALEDQHRTPDIERLTFEERLGLLLDREDTHRANRRLATRLKEAKLRLPASLEDIDYHAKRQLDRALLLELGGCSWIARAHNLLITGPTGVGKTYIACALAHKACREGYRVQYQRLPRLLHELEIARGDGRYRALLTNLQRFDLLALDDWATAPLTDQNRRDLLELFDDRYNTKSTLITSQLPPDAWHDYLSDPTLADAILDRIIHNAHKLRIPGDSLRKTHNPLTPPPTTSKA